MNKKDIKKITDVADQLHWSAVYNFRDKEFAFQKYSPASQDFNMNITADSVEELSEKLYERYNNFDCSEETYIWLDNSGHGRNGAPYDMKDLYEDMEACQEMIRELAVAIQNIC
jgi:hypothetical protein